MEKSWNDYDYDNNWDWNDNSYEDAANYIGGINGSHLTIGHIRQSESLPCKHKHKSPPGKKASHTQHHGTTTVKAFNNSYKRTQHNCTSTKQQQHKSKDKRILMTTSHTTSCTPKLHHVLQLQVIPPPADRPRSIYTCLPKDAPDLSLRPCGESVPQLCTVSNKKIPVYGVKYVPTSRTSSES